MNSAEYNSIQLYNKESHFPVANWKHQQVHWPFGRV